MPEPGEYVIYAAEPNWCCARYDIALDDPPDFGAMSRAECAAWCRDAIYEGRAVFRKTTSEDHLYPLRSSYEIEAPDGTCWEDNVVEPAVHSVYLTTAELSLVLGALRTFAERTGLDLPADLAARLQDGRLDID